MAGVGGAAASGLEAGFNMGLRADEAQERRKQREIDNTRTASLDAERTAERDRNNLIQDEDRELQGFNLGLEDQRYALGALQIKYRGNPAGIPEAEARPLIDQIAKTYGGRQAVIERRMKPIVEKGKQDARDFSSRAAVGAADPMTLPAPKFNEYILASTGFMPQQFLSGEVKTALTDAQAGLETQNFDLVFKAANVLLPEIRQGIGQIAPDGSVIVNKELVGFAPAPMASTEAGPPAPMVNPVQGLSAALTAATAPDSPAPAAGGNEPGPAGMLQPGTDPDKLLPIIKVTTRQPDGSLTSYPAPITKGRSAAPDAPLSGPVSMKDLMDRLGQIGVLNEWAQKPEVKAKMEAGAQGGKPTTFEQAWGMVHGDLKALTDDNDPTSKKIKAIQKLAVEQNIPFDEAARQLAAKTAPQATGVAGTLAAIKTSGLSDPDKAKAERVALGVDARPKAGKGVGSGGSSKTLGGAAAPGGGVIPDPKTEAYKKVVDFWTKAVIAGDKDWQVGLARGGKDAVGLIRDVKMNVPVLAAEMGLEPQDIGTARAQSAALGATLKDLTKRAEAVELFANKVEKDMKTFDNLLDNASTGSPLLISKPINYLRRQFSDSDLAQLDLAAKQVGAEYERLITGGTLSVAQLHVGAAEDAKKLINGDMPPKQARAVMDVMRQEMKNARGAAHESQGRVTDQLRGLGRGVPPPIGKGVGFGVAGINEEENAPSGKGVGGTAAPKAAVQTATNPKTGEKLQLVNGAWVPVK